MNRARVLEEALVAEEKGVAKEIAKLREKVAEDEEEEDLPLMENP